MKNALFASVALLFVGVAPAFAAMPAVDLDSTLATIAQDDFVQLARRGGDDSGGDDRGGDRGRGRGSDDAGGDDSSSSKSTTGARRGGGSTDDSPTSNSNRRKPRIPGGSGCDDAGDVAEHPECSQ